MTTIRAPTIIGTRVIAACALTGVVLAALPAAAQTTEQVHIGSDGASQANDGSPEPTLDTEGLSNQTVSTAVSDTVLSLHSEGNKFTLEFSGTTRRQVVERLFAASRVTVNWLDTAHAAELIEGRHVGSLEEIVNRLLSRTDYVIAYDMSGSAPRMTSVVILGRGLPSPNQKTLQSAPASYLTQKGLRDAARERARSVEPHERQRQLQARAELLQSMEAARTAALRRRQLEAKLLQRRRAAAARRRQ